MDAPAASDRIHRAAVLGDRTRRTAIALRRVTHFAVPVAALACLTAVLSVVLRGPRWVGPSVLGVALVTAGLAFMRARTRQPVVDRVAAELDRAANLGGAFRSACWFAAASAPATGPDAAWREFHVMETAERVTRLDWTKVYAAKVDRRAWLAACVLVTATLVVARWPAAADRVSPPPAPSASHAVPHAAVESATVLNTPALTDAIRAIKSGRVPPTESLAAVGHALDLARADAAAKTQLDELFSKTRADRPIGAWSGQPQDDDPDADERTQALVNPWAVEWAYQDAVSRASAARPSVRNEGFTPSTPDSTQPTAAGDDRRDSASGKGGTDGAAVLGQTRGQTAGFSSLLFGREQADGDGTPTSTREPASSPRTAALTTALRQEIIRASSDIKDVSPSGARRAADNESAPVTGGGARTTVTYDRGRGSQPPIIPADRRVLVHDVFLRPSDAQAPRPE
jgi:hypothetical protein